MADAKPDVKPAAPDGSAQINLKVRDTDTNTIQFKIKRSTPLSKLMNAYSSRLYVKFLPRDSSLLLSASDIFLRGTSSNAYRFMFDGERVAEDDTPEKLEMDDLDVIDAILEQQGGVSCL